MKWILSLLFLVRVSIPFGLKETYEVKRYEHFGEMYLLELTNGKQALVPAMWTIIEEK